MTRTEPIHRTRSFGADRWEGVGWRRRSVFGALGFRAPLSDISAAELELMLGFAEDAARIVEIGVFEGATAMALGARARREIVLVDPYPSGRLPGRNMAQIVAQRSVSREVSVPVRWIQLESTRAAEGWNDSIDFLRIDGIHTLEGVKRDWQDWSPYVVVGGFVAVRADVVSGGSDGDDGPHVGHEIVPWVLSRFSGWGLAGMVETTAVLRRIAD